MNFSRQRSNFRHWVKRSLLVEATLNLANQETLENRGPEPLQVVQARLSNKRPMFNPSSEHRDLQLPISLAQEAKLEYKYLRMAKIRGWGWILELDRPTSFEEHKWLTAQGWNYCFNFRWYKLDSNKQR